MAFRSSPTRQRARSRRARVLRRLLPALVGFALPSPAHDWDEVSNLSSPRQELPSVFLDGKIYLVGGMLEDPFRGSSTSFTRYDLATDSEEILPDLPYSVHHANAAALDGKVYIMGGWEQVSDPIPTQPEAVLDHVYQYDPDTSVFTQMDPMPTGVAAAAAIAQMGKIYVIGGTDATTFNGSGNVNLVQVFDPAAPAGSQWSVQSSSMPDPRNHLHAVEVDGMFYISPGRSRTPGNERDWGGVQIQRYDPDTATWENNANLAPLDTARGRSAGGFAGVNGKLYYIGGESNDTPSTNAVIALVDCYDPQTNLWESLDPIPQGVHGMSAVTADRRGNKIYLPGGGEEEGVAPSVRIQRMTVCDDQEPFGGLPHPVPGRIEAEDFDLGGAEVAFHDESPAYRGEPVGIVATPDDGGGYVVTDTADGEWLEYTCDLTVADGYLVTARAATPDPGAALRLWIDGVFFAELPLEQTAGPASFAESEIVAFAGPGLVGPRALLRVEMVGGGFDLNWLEFEVIDTTPPEVLSAAAISESMIEVVYSEPVRSGTGPNGAENIANHAIDGGVTVLSAQLAADLRTVIVRTTPLGDGIARTLTISNVADDGDPPIPLAAPAVLPVIHRPRVETGLVALYQFEELGGDTIRDGSGFGPPLNLTIDDPGFTSRPPGALTIGQATRIHSNGPASKVNDAIEASSELTVEAWIEPANLTQDGPARILAISQDGSSRNLTLGQEADFYQFRLRADNTGPNGSGILVETAPGTLTTALTHVVYTRDTSGAATLYLDGASSATGTIGNAGQPLGWDSGYELSIGNETTGDRPWLGTLHLVALYDRALTPGEVTQNFDAGARSGTLGCYESWRRSHFTAAQLADPAVSGDDADPDMDGIANWREGAHFLDPLAASTPPLSEISLDPDGFLVATIERPYLNPDFDFTVELSGDLNNWLAEAITAGLPVENPDGSWTFLYRDPETVDTRGQRFMRYELRQAP